MPKLDCPLQLCPVFKPKIWGRRDLSPLFDSARAPACAGELIGEVWITDSASRFMNGPVAGMTLAEASKNLGPQLNGASWKEERFPILAKYIFTTDWLSVQVHPDDDYARVHDPGSPGKTEMWYVVHSERGAEVMLGLKKGVTEEALRSAITKGGSRELLNRFHPKNDEAVFVPPGTIHALGPGLVLFEVEENSDLTYRLDDFGRVGLDGKRRPLHLEKGLDVTRPELPAYRDLPRLVFKEPFGSRRFVMACRHFALEELTLRKAGRFEANMDRIEVLSLLAGDGRVEAASGWMAYRTGETWLIPPAAGSYRLVPAHTTRVLKSYVPDPDKDFRKPLARRGVKGKELQGVVFN